MKIWLVNEDIDLGYHVRKVFLEETKAQEYAENLRTKELSDNKYYNPAKIWVESLDVEGNKYG